MKLPGARVTEPVGRLIADLLGRDIDVRVRVSGRSMAPFLKSGDIVTLHRVRPEDVGIGDIVLCAADSGHPILHRVLRSWRNDAGERIIQTRGDSCLKLDIPVLRSEVLGRVRWVEREAATGSRERRLNLESRRGRLRARIAAWGGLIMSGLYYKAFRPLASLCHAGSP